MPFTGANSIPVAVAGLLLLLVGAAGVLASRRLRAR
jgi:LPXTG-motif cell wall-anchored protein